MAPKEDVYEGLAEVLEDFEAKEAGIRYRDSLPSVLNRGYQC